MIKKLRAFIGKTQEGYMKMKKSKVTVFIAAAVAIAAFTFFVSLRQVIMKYLGYDSRTKRGNRRAG